MRDGRITAVLVRNEERKRLYHVAPELEPYLKAAEDRKELPSYVMAKIEKCAKYILEKYPEIRELYLIGSYANGTYVDENTSDEFKELKRKALVRVKTSDFDFETKPLLFSSWVSPEGYHIQLCSDRVGHRINLEYLLSL